MLMRFDPFREVDRLTEQIDQMFRRSAASTVPMDAVRHEGQVFVSFDLPGVDPDAIDVSVERNVLTVTATRKFETAEGDDVIVNERPQGTFTRRLMLSENVDTDAIEASYDHGVLTVTLPVAEDAKPRKIAIGGAHKRDAIEAQATEAEPAKAEQAAEAQAA
ncbi:MAG TPA: Hsp20/alpha crystallin family protein [Acidimicrobiales bacterium]